MRTACFLLALFVAGVALATPRANTKSQLVQSGISSLRDEFLLSESIKTHSSEINQLIQNLMPEIEKAAEMMTEGICKFKGFCKSNPAKTCLEILDQDGIRNQTELSDGKYWLQLDHVMDDGVLDQSSPPVHVECLMQGPNGVGWMLLFDETGNELISQDFNPDLENVRFKETLAFTPADLLTKHPVGRSSFFYNVDSTHPDHPTSVGFTPAQMMYGPWVGQDGYGKSDAGAMYPHHANHFRFKFFGKPDISPTHTLYVLDDGAIGPDRCRNEQLRGSCFTDADDAPYAQTCYSSRGLLSFGCYDSQTNFTQCGTCLYGGYGDKQEVIRRSVVQKLYVR
eukprot:c5935_g1_i1.p1 GENE.c5935_g1_i1~~c5935_g1_i1.p1  ORF type:complete len:339 (-),score=84.80 c5935_g1_i1:51-1067(-)